MDLPLALAALFLLLLLLAAPPATLFLALHLHRRRRRRREPRLTPSEPAAADLEPRAPTEEEKRPRRRARRKQPQQEEEKDGDATAAAGGDGEDDDDALPRRPRFPLASVAGALQRRITARYDDLARASQAQCLTIDQVHEFLDSIVDARNELLQKSENARRKLTIKKALLSNTRNCRSSHDELRLSKQVDKLESEYERLIKDAAIYDHLQEQLRLSVHYKRMEANDAKEKEALEQALAAEEPDMTFEELLAEEKKDAAFWWPGGKLRSISNSM